MSETFTIDNDLNITEFEVIYQNNTERIFKIDLQNTFTSTTISNISWEFNSGENIRNSELLLHLEPQEETFFYVYHNYSSSGSYNVTFKASSGFYIEEETIEVVV